MMTMLAKAGEVTSVTT